MYDTSNPYEWRYYKSVDYIGGRWTITDASLSPDNRHLAYSSITSRVFLADTNPGDDGMIPLDFSHGAGRGGNRNAMDPHYGVGFIFQEIGCLFGSCLMRFTDLVDSIFWRRSRNSGWSER